MSAGTPGGPGSGAMELGAPGPLRLLNGQLAGQASWLLPLAVVGLLLAAGWQRRPRLPLDQWHAGLVLWGTWFVTVAAYLSVAAGGHRYYTVMLAPAAAALVGMGATTLWKDYQSPGWRGWLLPLVLVGMAAVQAYILFDYPVWRAWLIPAIAGLGLGAAGLLTIARLRNQRLGKLAPLPAVAASVGVLALLIAPAAWASYDVLSSQGGGGMGLPSAGPRTSQAFGLPGGGPGGPPGGRPPGGGPPGGGPGGPGGGRAAEPALVEYLQTNKGDATYLVAVSNAMSASPIILNTEEPVVSFGGYNGVDPVFTAEDLADLVRRRAVRFFLMPDREAIEEMMAERESGDNSSGGAPAQGGPRGGPGPGVGAGPGGGLPQNGSADWVEGNCEKVPQELWQSNPEDGGGGGPPMARARALYDCGAGGQ
jgi:4-amino-4-deoxy-L-arabinose transferase-like glycosyltransferase